MNDPLVVAAIVVAVFCVVFWVCVWGGLYFHTRKDNDETTR